MYYRQWPGVFQQKAQEMMDCHHCTGLLDWTTGLSQTEKYTSFSAEQNVNVLIHSITLLTLLSTTSLNFMEFLEVKVTCIFNKLQQWASTIGIHDQCSLYYTPGWAYLTHSIDCTHPTPYSGSRWTCSLSLSPCALPWEWTHWVSLSFSSPHSPAAHHLSNNVDRWWPFSYCVWCSVLCFRKEVQHLILKV